MAPLASDRIWAGDERAVDDNTAADAGSKNRGEDDPCARARAVGGLRQPEAIGVVSDPDRPAERSCEIVAKRAADQNGAVGILYEAGER